MNLSEAEKWLDHLTSCSPCYRDFSQFQTAYRSRRTRTLVAPAATILMLAFAGWGLLPRQKTPLVLRPNEPPAPRPEEPLITRTAVTDVRDRSTQRRPQPRRALPPPEVAPHLSDLESY